MEVLRKFVNVLALAFIVIAGLILFNILSVEYLDGNFTNFNPQNFFHTMFAIGTGLLLVYLIITNLQILSLKRERNLAEAKINELKAKLYDQRSDDIREARAKFPNAENEPLADPSTPSEPI